ncbi:anthranilate phosphoribosyltransferase [Pueribacillus theae]|uniref:Anthranilate phosphoribosyltransferase n=1 Tax=Pueribacillus theae TaxID=2171751 RepID=A0A2U1K631_9BACI|nr:anthranilate phosphoribosyltransferase [Pueribacillus theae]PWA12368.1 anthranilate phosphoribosyltransferase [Pueribacillus theae]
MFKEYLQQAINGKTFNENEAKLVMDEIMAGRATSSQIASLLTIMKLRETTIDELTGFVRSMRNHATSVVHDEKLLLDTCGTGGDGASTFNISTTVSFILAANGVPVAKHGNRSVSSKSGSADVLEKLGVPIQSTPEEAARKLKENRMSFLFAPLYHSSMKHAVVPRREIGFRTVFNILGPMTNPAKSSHQLLGVYDRQLADRMVQSLKRLGTKRALLVTGRDGLDECSISSETDIIELKNGEISHFTISPEQVGLKRASNEDITVASVEESAKLVDGVLKGDAPEAAINIVLLNAGAALYTVGRAGTIAEGVHEARKIIGSGAAYRKLEEMKSQEVQLHA